MKVFLQTVEALNYTSHAATKRLLAGLLQRKTLMSKTILNIDTHMDSLDANLTEPEIYTAKGWIRDGMHEMLQVNLGRTHDESTQLCRTLLTFLR